MTKNRAYTIAIDFDGTCVTHAFPHVGKEIGAVKPLRALTDNGHKLILYTMRDHNELSNSWNPEEHDTLEEAIAWFAKNDIPLYGVNENPDQTWSNSRKVYADLYIDDATLGTPLRLRPEFSPRPFVDWNKVTYMLYELGLINSEQLQSIGMEKVL